MSSPRNKRKESAQPTPNLAFEGEVHGAVFNFGAQTGVTSTGANAEIHQEQKTGLEATEVLQLLAQLQSLLTEARKQGAEAAACEAGEKAAGQVAAAAKNPQDPQAKEQAGGAMAILEKTSKGLDRFADIGVRFEKILTLLTPALTALMQRFA